MGPLFDSFDPWNVFLTWNAKDSRWFRGEREYPPKYGLYRRANYTTLGQAQFRYQYYAEIKDPSSPA